MGQGHSLLKRIRHPELAVARRAVSDTEIRESVRQHLQLMCTTRQGAMLTCPDFGTATVSEMVHAFPDAIAEMARSIKHTLSTYEPRLTNIRIVHIPTDDMTLRYEIHARLDRGGGTASVQFETHLDVSRQLSVR